MDEDNLEHRAKRRCAQAKSSKNLQQSVPSALLPEGPKEAKDLHKWPVDVCSRLPDDLQVRLLRACNKGVRIILSSSYSGIGSAEWSLKMVTQARCLLE